MFLNSALYFFIVFLSVIVKITEKSKIKLDENVPETSVWQFL